MRRCDVCQVRVGPCVDENGVALEQYHVARVRTDAMRDVLKRSL